jgi:hypothetical protein
MLMNLQELIEALDQRYGNPYAKECHLIQEGIKVLRKQQEEIDYWKDKFEKSMGMQEK